MPESLKEWYEQLMGTFGLKGLQIPVTAIKIYPKGKSLPDPVKEYHLDDLTLTGCQACRQASYGDAVCLTLKNIGCIAAAISFGLVSSQSPEPLGGPRVYTDLMRAQASVPDSFSPPSPKDFSEGIVYACQAAGRMDFNLFGPEDSGRYQDLTTARRAIAAMSSISPATTQAVFFYPVDFEEDSIRPDLLVLNVRPVELTRLIQACQYQTGQPSSASMGALRVVCSDLIARPFLTKKINISTYCLGARLIGKYEAERLGIGIPYELLDPILDGMKKSKTGYPFHLYPGA